MMRHPYVVLFGLVESSVLVFVTLRVLPVHVPWVDGWLLTLAAVRLVASLAFLLRPGLAARRALVASLAASLVTGMAAAAALFVSAATVAGVYDAVGDGTALFFGTSALFVLPYLVFAPTVALHSLLRTDLRDAPR